MSGVAREHPRARLHDRWASSRDVSSVVEGCWEGMFAAGEQGGGREEVVKRGEGPLRRRKSLVRKKGLAYYLTQLTQLQIKFPIWNLSQVLFRDSVARSAKIPQTSTCRRPIPCLCAASSPRCSDLSTTNNSFVCVHCYRRRACVRVS